MFDYENELITYLRENNCKDLIEIMQNKKEFCHDIEEIKDLCNQMPVIDVLTFIVFICGFLFVFFFINHVYPLGFFFLFISLILFIIGFITRSICYFPFESWLDVLSKEEVILFNKQIVHIDLLIVNSTHQLSKKRYQKKVIFLQK